MIKNLLLLALCFISFNAFSQETPIPVDSASGKVLYTEVVEVTDLSRSLLYGNAKAWYAESFKSANDVIQNDDKENGIIQGKANSIIWDGAYRLSYNIKVMVKDGRYKYDFSNMNLTYITPGQPLSGSEYSVEKMTLENMYNKNGKPNKFVHRMRKEVSDEIKNLVASLHASMVKNNDNW